MYYTCTNCSKHMGGILEDPSGAMEYPAFYSILFNSPFLDGISSGLLVLSKIHEGVYHVMRPTQMRNRYV